MTHPSSTTPTTAEANHDGHTSGAADCLAARSVYNAANADDDPPTIGAVDDADDFDDRHPEPVWAEPANTVSAVVAARDAAIDRHDLIAATHFAAQARAAIAAATAAGASMNDLAGWLDYPGGGPALDGDHIDSLLQPIDGSAEQAAVAAARDAIAGFDWELNDPELEVRVNPDGRWAIRTGDSEVWTVASRNPLQPPHLAHDFWVTGQEWREVRHAELAISGQAAADRGNAAGQSEEDRAFRPTAGDTYWAQRAVAFGPAAAARERLAVAADEAGNDAEIAAERAQRAREVITAAARMTVEEAARVIDADRTFNEHIRDCHRERFLCATCRQLEDLDAHDLEKRGFDVDVAQLVVARASVPGAPAEGTAPAPAPAEWTQALRQHADRREEASAGPGANVVRVLGARIQDLRELARVAEVDLDAEAADAVARFLDAAVNGSEEDLARQDAVREAAAATAARRGASQFVAREVLAEFPETTARAREALQQAAAAAAAARTGAGAEVARLQLGVAVLEYALISLETQAGGDTAAAAIGLLQEYRDSHGCGPERAREQALADISEGTQATIELANYEAEDYYALAGDAGVTLAEQALATAKRLRAAPP
jgi:hypothetical protein